MAALLHTLHAESGPVAAPLATAWDTLLVFADETGEPDRPVRAHHEDPHSGSAAVPYSACVAMLSAFMPGPLLSALFAEPAQAAFQTALAAPSACQACMPCTCRGAVGAPALQNVGAALARLQQGMNAHALASAPGQQVHYPGVWSVEHTGEIEPAIGQLAAAIERVPGLAQDASLVALVRAGLAVWRDHLLPAQEAQALPKSWIHGDPNDNNIIMRTESGAADVQCFVDYDDHGYTCRVYDLAIACTYAAMSSPDPLAIVMHLAQGFHRVLPLAEAEIYAIVPAMIARLTVSVTMGMLTAADAPENAEYVLVHAVPGIALLKAALAWSVAGVGQALHVALVQADTARVATSVTVLGHGVTASPPAGWQLDGAVPPAAPTLAAERALQAANSGWQRSAFTTVGTCDGGDAWTAVDLPPVDGGVLEQGLAVAASAGSALVPLGRWGETRACYTSDHYVGEQASQQRRTVHLGIDVFLPAGTPMFAPAAMALHSCAYDAAPQGYGWVLLLRVVGVCPDIMLLVGHVSEHTAWLWQQRSVIGQHAVSAGSLIGWVGSAGENGSWPPHAHVQWVATPDAQHACGDVPGVATAAAAPAWLAACPQPTWLMQAR